MQVGVVSSSQTTNSLKDSVSALLPENCRVRFIAYPSAQLADPHTFKHYFRKIKQLRGTQPIVILVWDVTTNVSGGFVLQQLREQQHTIIVVHAQRSLPTFIASHAFDDIHALSLKHPRGPAKLKSLLKKTIQRSHKRLHVRLPADLYAFVEQHCAINGLTKAGLIRTLLVRYRREQDL